MATLPPVNRERFERLLLRRLDQHRHRWEGKRLIGGAWQTIINDMYKKNSARFSANDPAAVTSCADAILRLMKSLRD
jgi:hypothetical protein